MVDPVGDEAAVGIVVDMLELASAAFGKVAAWRHHMVRSGKDRASRVDRVPRGGERKEAAALGDSVAARGEPDDLLA